MSFSQEDQLFMKRAIDLAQIGLGFTGTNPLVGCVIAKEGKVIGEGWHQKWGGPHAEVNAVRSVKNPNDLDGATVYVSLEPCAHFGKTPPCALLLRDLPISEVVIALKDPFPKVAGKGIEILKEAGKKVRTGLLTKEAAFQNRRFLTRLQEHRPYIILKWAESANGIIGQRQGKPLAISDPANKILVHKWRSEEMAILVGAGTYLQDQPQLNLRFWSGNAPKRFIFSPNNSFESDLRNPDIISAFTTQSPWYILNKETSKKEGGGQWISVSESKVESFLKKSLKKMSDEFQIASVLIEGGSKTHQLFLDLGLWDEIRVLKSVKNQMPKEPVWAPTLPQMEAIISDLGNDTLYTYFNRGFNIW